MGAVVTPSTPCFIFDMSIRVLLLVVVMMNPHGSVYYSVTAVGTTTATATNRSPPFQWQQNDENDDTNNHYSNHHHHYRTFRTTGPIVTITIPHDLTSIITEIDHTNDDMEDSVQLPTTKRFKSFWKTNMSRTRHQFQSIVDTTLDLLQPNCIYTIQTIPGQLPLPHWLPSLKSCTTRFQYFTTSTTATRSSSSSSSSSHIPSIHNSPHTSWNGALTASSAPTTRTRATSRSSYCSIEGLTKLEWNHRLFRNSKNNNILQIAIQPYQEWVTTRSTTKKALSSSSLSSSSSTTSVLLHAKSGNANYAWLRCAISSLLPTSSSSSPQPESRSALDPSQQSYETSMRASTKVLVPMASIASIRVTPTIRWIQQCSLWPQQQSTVPPVTDPKPNRQHFYDASCDVEVTSGGSGRTTATLTITPCSNLATMTGTMKKSIITLAMEYRLSGGLNLLRRPWKSRPSHQIIAITTRPEPVQPQHWIRQIWEWRPSHTRTSDGPNRLRSMSMVNRIIASQYQWLILWPSGQSVRTIFDPPSPSYWDCQDCGFRNGGVTFTWTDPTNQNYWSSYDTSDEHLSGDGTWITDIRIPFVARPTIDNITRTTKSLLWQNLYATEIRIRRQFHF